MSVVFDNTVELKEGDNSSFSLDEDSHDTKSGEFSSNQDDIDSEEELRDHNGKIMDYNTAL